MTSLGKSWLLSSRYTTRPLRSTLCASSALFLISLRYDTAGAGSTGWGTVLFCAAYAGVLSLLLLRYYRSRKTPQTISVDGGTLSIPRFFCKPHRIHYDEIKSVEKCSASKKNQVTLIGRFNKSSILLDISEFSSAEDFEDFVSFAAKCASENQSADYLKCTASIAARSNANSQSATVLISLTWLIMYTLVCTTGVSEIHQSAIAQGALTKDTLKPAELYRIASSFFVHLTPFHLGLNVLAFAFISRNIQIILGSVRLVNILILSAVSGALFSLAFSGYPAVLGASGGIFGLLGAYFVICVRYPRSFPGSVSTSSGYLALLLALQCAIDIAIPGIDVSSHLGGFLFGVVYAHLISRVRSAARFEVTSPAEFRVAVTASCLYIGGLLYFLSLYFNLH